LPCSPADARRRLPPAMDAYREANRAYWDEATIPSERYQMPMTFSIKARKP